MNKIVLKRMLLKNWTTINRIITFSDTSTLLTGANGSGKSTVVDALNLVLSGSKHFNEASDKSNKNRSIASAIHNYNFTTHEVSRKSKVIGYIILEFYDESNDMYFLNGLQMKSDRYSEHDNNVVEKYFAAPFLSLEDIREQVFDADYATSDIISGSGRLSKITVYENKEQAFRHFFKMRKMKVSDWKIYSRQNSKVLKAKLVDSAGKKLTPNTFVKTYVLGDPKGTAKTTMDSMKSQKDSFLNLKRSFESLEEKRNSYEEILNAMKKLFSYQDELLLATGASLSCKRDVTVTSIDTLNKKLEILINELNGLNEKSGTLKRERKELQERLTTLQRSIDTKSVSVHKELEDLKKKIHQYEDEEIRFDSLINGTLYRLNKKYEFGLEFKDSKKVFEDGLNLIEKKAEELQAKISEKNILVSSLKQDIEALSTDVKSLEKGIIVNDNKGSECLKNKMNDLMEKNGSSDRAYLLYELIEEIDPEWQNAIELFLGKRRYALIVGKEYEKMALSVYRDFPGSSVARYRDYREVPNNAAEKVKIKFNDKNATQYVNSLLKGVKLCETVEDLQKTSIGIMKDGRASNAYMYTNVEKKGLKLLCGQEAIKKELISKKQELHDTRDRFIKQKDELQILNSELKELNEQRDTLVENKNLIIFSVKEDLILLNKKREEIEKELLTNKEEESYIRLVAERDKVSEQLLEIEETNSNILTKIGAQDEKIKFATKTLEGKLDEEKKLKEEYEEKYGSINDDIHEYISSHTSAIPDMMQTLIQSLNNSVAKQTGNVTRIQTQYQNKDKLFVPGTDRETYEKINEKFEQIKDVELMHAKEKLDEHARIIEKSKDSFFQAVYADYKNARETVNELNAKLRKVPFCGDTIRIKISINRDELNKFEAIERSYADIVDTKRSGIPMEKTKADDEILDNLFKKMLNSTGDEYSKYENYKTYIDTEVILTRIGEDGIEKSRSLEEDNKSNSGGQEQTPYYIILAISMLTFFNDDGIKLILLDEAFGKMDANRAGLVLKFFNEIQLQTVLSTYREDIHSIVDISNTFMRNNLTGQMSIFMSRYKKEKGKSELIDEHTEEDIKEIA